ncbi:AraC family transcriptional regulator [Paenibacillaceae bacterium]|nr:AraC family transcriptional regulator [Paenibacillaceae bacterium]
MIDVDLLARTFAGGCYELIRVHRLVIQPKSILREFKTDKHGFVFPVRGEAHMHVDGIGYELRPGTVLHAAPGMRMDSQVIGQSEYEYYSVFYRLDKREEEDCAPECSKHFRLEPGTNSRVIELLAMLHQNIYAAGGLEQLRAKELFLSLMHQVLAGCNYRDDASSADKKVIEAAVAYISGYYMHPLTLDELAGLHAMSPKRFSYFFHKYTGYRPIDYVIHYRMERAKELLRTGSFPIRDVAASVGYANPLYFSRAFKQRFGVSPSAYMGQGQR